MKDFLKLLAWSFVLMFITALVSCSPQRRFTRLIEKYPELIEAKYQTYYDTITVVVNGVKTDTIVHREILKDTLVLKKEQLKVVIYEKGDSVYVEGECDTVYVNKEVEVEVPIYYYEKEEGFWNKLLTSIKYIMWIFVVVAVVAIIYNFIKSRK